MGSAFRSFCGHYRRIVVARRICQVLVVFRAYVNVRREGRNGQHNVQRRGKGVGPRIGRWNWSGCNNRHPRRLKARLGDHERKTAGMGRLNLEAAVRAGVKQAGNGARCVKQLNICVGNNRACRIGHDTADGGGLRNCGFAVRRVVGACQRVGESGGGELRIAVREQESESLCNSKTVDHAAWRGVQRKGFQNSRKLEDQALRLILPSWKKQQNLILCAFSRTSLMDVWRAGIDSANFHSHCKQVQDCRLVLA